MLRYPQTIALILAALVSAGGSAFLGYHYLGLLDDYRARNLVHLAAVTEAKTRLGDGEMRRAEGRARIAGLIETATAQAAWCTAVLTPLEARLFTALGAAPALDICVTDRQRGMVALALMAQAEQGEDVRIPLREQLEAMRRDSVEFVPYVDVLGARLSRIVRAGTLAGLVAIGAIAAVLMRANMRLTARVLAEAQAQKRMADRFSHAIAATPEGFALFDDDEVLIACNDTYRALSCADPEAIMPGMTRQEVKRAGVRSGFYGAAAQEDPERFIADLHARAGDPSVRCTLELPGDRHLSISVSTTPEGDSCSLRSDITEFVRAERQLAEHARALEAANAAIREHALHDPLTGLPNRRYLDTRLAAALAEPEAGVTVIRIDLDRFKQVNDVLGHEAGDHVLCEVAGILRATCGEEDFPARVGGDEFVVLCAPGRTLEEADRLARRLLERILRPIRYRGKPCRFGASFGVARRTGAGTGADELLSHADAALYEAKAAGRRRVAVFTPALHARILEERRLGDEFADALETGQIVPHFQTQHRASDHAVCGAEVLARWDHPRRGLLAPPAFLGVARGLGLEGALDARVFSSALAALGAHELRLPRLSFNVSAGRVTDPDFLAAAREARAGLAAGGPQLAFELLESVALEDMDEAFWMNIDALRDLGYALEIDDFGSGHASINGVVRLQPAALKIDRALIRPLGESPSAQALVAAILQIGRAMELRVTAEGVETAAQAELLRALGVDMLQGYHFSRPLAAGDLATFLAGRRIVAAA